MYSSIFKVLNVPIFSGFSSFEHAYFELILAREFNREGKDLQALFSGTFLYPSTVLSGSKYH